MLNYIKDENKFKLAGPPQWFLQRLAEFDPSLVIVPSRQGFYYRLAQRRKLQLPDHIVQEALWQFSDTQMLASHSLVPVTTILATCNWSNPLIWQELSDRAPWRNGGHEKVNALLDQRDLDTENAANMKTDELNTNLAKDGWKLYRKKIGLGSTQFNAPARGWQP